MAMNENDHTAPAPRIVNQPRHCCHCHCHCAPVAVPTPLPNPYVYRGPSVQVIW